MKNPFRAFYILKREQNKSLELSTLGSSVAEIEAVGDFHIRRRFHFSRKTAIFALLLFYALAVPAYLYFGLHLSGSNAAAAYAEEAKNATGLLEIPAINLVAPLADVSLENHVLTAPDYIAGRYSRAENKTLLMGHSSTIFRDLEKLTLGAKIIYDGAEYTVTDIKVKPKSEISMTEILQAEENPTLILMTCHGENIGNNDYSHRLIITAE